MKKTIIVLFIIFINIQIFSRENPFKLSPSSEISIITVYPGNEIYSMFGHSAIRVHDRTGRIDFLYNFGTFDFYDTWFIAKFIYGKLDYILGVDYTKNAFYQYKNFEDRTIVEQILNISLIEKQKIFDYLYEESKPENRTYPYNFLFDNCSTRVLDVLTFNLGNLTSKNNMEKSNFTFRQELQPYLKKAPFLRLGIDIIFGLPADRKPIGSEITFLPIRLMEYLDNLTIEKSNLNLVILKQTLHKPLEIPENKYIDPVHLIFICLILLSVLFLFYKKAGKYFDIFIFSFSGLVGLVILLFWIFTKHAVIAFNPDLIWAIPVNLFISYSLLYRKNIKFTNIYFIVYSFLLIIIITGWHFLSKFYYDGIIYLLICLLIRSLSNIDKSILKFVYPKN